MSTRSLIGIVKKDGSIQSIYCHHDGYFEGVGKVLTEDYKDPEKVEALIELGDISSLGETLESTVAYHRDRGEEISKHFDPSEKGFLKSAKGLWGEFAYLFDDGMWKSFRL